MSTESRVYWTIRCDSCKGHLGNDNYDYTVHDSEADVIVAATDSDWRVFPGIVVCCWCIDKGVIPKGAHADDPDDAGVCRWCGDDWPCEASSDADLAEHHAELEFASLHEEGLA